VATAQKVVAEAQGLADAKKIDADAISYYNQKVQQSTNQDVIQLKWIEKWDGHLQPYQFGTGSNQGLMLNLNK
jgi:hypothetical protein